MDAKFIEELLDQFYKYAIVGGILILFGLLLKNFITILATNIWMRIFSRSRIANKENIHILENGEWWRIRSLGFNRVQLFKPNLGSDGKPDEDTPEIFLEMPISVYWKSKIIYK